MTQSDDEGSGIERTDEIFSEKRDEFGIVES